MFELADRLVGIYKTNNCTKSVTINPKAFGGETKADRTRPSTTILGEATNNNEFGTVA
jgi:structural maintenance of chromosome 4